MLLRAHNKETYANIVELYKTENRVAVVQPTGTGKSYLILQLIADNADKHFAVCSPSVYIFSQLDGIAMENKISLDNVAFLTYSRLAQMTESEIKAHEFDYIVLDEFHRCGAIEWGRGVEDLLSVNEGAKVLGTSATPIRYLDSGRNMAEEIFHGVYAVNMSLAEAIRKKILPLPIYVTSWYSFRGDIEQLEIKAEQTGNPRLKQVLMGKIQKAKSMISEVDVGIDKIFEKHIPNPSGKYIVFCPNIEHLKSIIDDCNSWFNKVNANIHKYAVFSTNNDSNQQFEDFRFDNDSKALKLLFCVDMLNEGVHFDDIDGVIMLRATKSANVFYQQLGRALACSERNAHPVIFDIVNNFETGDTAQQYASIMDSVRNGEGDYDYTIEFELYDYVRDIREILNELNSTFANSWEFNFELLKEYVETHQCFPDSRESFHGVLIGTWAVNQRQLYNQGKLSAERIDKLNSIGFTWNLNDSNWFAVYKEMKLVVETLGHFPNKSELAGGKEYLQRWLNRQRSKYRDGTLEEEKKNMLLALGWKIKTNNTADWEERFQQLTEFIEKNGRFPTNSDAEKSAEIRALYTWMNSQRRKLLKGTLPDGQIKKLEEINFPVSRQETQWDRKFRLLKEYYSKCAKIPGVDVVVDGVNLGKWYITQSKAYASGKMSAGRIKEFESANIPLDYSIREVGKSKTWNRNYNSYVEFLKKYGRKPKVSDPDGGRIYRWAFGQMKAIQDNLLSAEQVAKLAEVGITADGR